jgi:hypothetical protein
MSRRKRIHGRKRVKRTPIRFSLNPPADKVLAEASYRASMANVPKDISGTFEKMADDYGESRRAIGSAIGGAIGGVLSGLLPGIKGSS